MNCVNDTMIRMLESTQATFVVASFSSDVKIQMASVPMKPIVSHSHARTLNDQKLAIMNWSRVCGIVQPDISRLMNA